MANKRGQRKSRQSFFLDQVLSEFSLASCACELFFPEPSFRFNDQGVIEEICGDIDTQGFSKQCRVHLCEIPGVSPEFNMVSQEADEDSKIYLNVILNGLCIGDLTFQKKTDLKHEFQRKVGQKWRKFLLQYNQRRSSKQFITTLENHLNKLKTTEDKENTFLLLAVPPAVTRTSVLNRLNRNSTASDRPDSESESENSSAEEEEKDLEGQKEQEVKEQANSGVDFRTFPSLTPPFDPAPFSPTFPGYPPFSGLQSLPESDKEDLSCKNTDSLTDSLNIHTSELPQSLQSVLRSIYKAEGAESRGRLNSGAKQPSPDRQCDEVLNSEFLPTEKLYIPMGMHTRETMEDISSPSRLKEEVEKLAQLLQTAINDKEINYAQDYAKQLAMKNVTVTISVRLKSSEIEEKHKEFNLKVYIEDKETSGAIIMLKVKSTDTIRDLKNRMLMKHGFPMEVQNWIVGQRIPPDNQTLAQCRIKTDGHSAYLYLVSAKSVGLSKEDSLQRQGPGLLTIAVEPPAVPDAPVIQRAVSTGSSHSGSRHASIATPGSAAAGPASKNSTLEPNLNKKQEKKQSSASKLPAPAIQEDRPIQVVLGTPKEGLGLARPNIGPVQQPGRVPEEHNEASASADVEVGQIKGWSCRACTFINQPTRPGCEVCSNPRPDDYVVPPTYVMTEEEKLRLENESNLERQTLEGGQEGKYDSAREKELAELLKLHDALQETLQNRDLDVRPDQQELHMELFGMGRNPPEGSDTEDENSEEERQRNERLRERTRNYQFLQQTDAQDVIPNTEDFTCPICFDAYEKGEGVVLRECLHTFCRDCLRDAVLYNEEPVLKCPYQDDDYACDGVLQDREIKAVATPEIYDRYLARSLATAESQAANSFHCKTADCPGWCIYEDHVNFFVCPVCRKENCLTCKAIHQGMNCKEYQEDLKIRARNDGAANQTQIMINMMLQDGDAMACPQCQVIVMKKEGCDWIQCSICKTEICWVTKGPRWGPLGNGDISGGCRCRVDGQICHPNCNNCH